MSPTIRRTKHATMKRNDTPSTPLAPIFKMSGTYVPALNEDT